MGGKGSIRSWIDRTMCLAAVMGGLGAALARAEDNGPGLNNEDICRLAGGIYRDLGGDTTRCCLPDWGCYHCIGSDCYFECTTRRCCEMNGGRGMSRCFIISVIEQGDVDEQPGGFVGDHVLSDHVLGELSGALLEFEALDDAAGEPDLLLEQADLMLEANADGETDEEQIIEKVELTEDPPVQMCGAGMLFPMMLGLTGFTVVRRRGSAARP